MFDFSECSKGGLLMIAADLFCKSRSFLWRLSCYSVNASKSELPTRCSRAKFSRVAVAHRRFSSTATGIRSGGYRNSLSVLPTASEQVRSEYVIPEAKNELFLAITAHLPLLEIDRHSVFFGSCCKELVPRFKIPAARSRVKESSRHVQIHTLSQALYFNRRGCDCLFGDDVWL